MQKFAKYQKYITVSENIKKYMILYGICQETIFGPPRSPLLSILYIVIIVHVARPPSVLAAAPGPLACPSHSARPRNCLRPT